MLKSLHERLAVVEVDPALFRTGLDTVDAWKVSEVADDKSPLSLTWK